jgi:hypothetical protein
MPTAVKNTRTRPALPVALGLLLLGLGAPGCGKKGIATELQVLKDAGRNVSAFTDTDAAALGAKRCQSGTIDGIQALLCEYGGKDAATQGLAAAQTWLADAPTGLALQHEIVVLALADRSGADPSGKSLDAISKAFRRTARK